MKREGEGGRGVAGLMSRKGRGGLGGHMESGKWKGLVLRTPTSSKHKFEFNPPAGNERLGDFTPAFLWLLRDFYLKLEEEGVKV